MKERFGLYLILTDPIAGYEACAEAAVAAGIRYLQLRMKNVAPREQLRWAKRLRAVTRGSDTLFIVNDDLDIAIQSDADGIHLGQDDLSLAEARTRWTAPGKRFGLSTHGMEQAKEAAEANPDLIGVGPVFPTPTKPDADPALGVAETARVMTVIPVTSVAIGGINTDTLPNVLAAGIHNFCVVSAVNASPDPAAAIRQLQEIRKQHAI